MNAEAAQRVALAEVPLRLRDVRRISGSGVHGAAHGNRCVVGLGFNYTLWGRRGISAVRAFGMQAFYELGRCGFIGLAGTCLGICFPTELQRCSQVLVVFLPQE